MIYTLEPARTEPELIAALEGRFRLGIEEAPHRRLTYLDSFDWRLHRDGGTLAAIGDRQATLLLWRSLDGEARHRLLANGVPRFARDLPPGPLATALGSLLEMRCLLPVAEVEIEGRELRLLDGNDKTVVRLHLERPTVVDPAAPGDSGQPLPLRLRLVPVKGYVEELERARSLLETDLGLSHVEGDELSVALAALGRRPRDYTSKLEIPLESGMRADAAARTIYRHLLATLETNEEGVLRDLDPEFLHDFRVAVRRTRSALGQIRGVLPQEEAKHFRRELAWLGRATGPTRDLDVYLLKFDGYRADLPGSVRADLDPLRVFLQEHQRIEQRKLARVLRSKRTRRLLTEWSAFLGRETPAEEEPPNAALPVGEVASARIRRALHRVLEHGRGLGPQTPAAKLHRLRIDCKKLRYLLELFRGLYHGAEIEPLIRSLKKLQDCLGDFNDYEVQQKQLAGFADAMVLEDLAPVPTLLAMGRLLERLARGQERERRRFAERFAAFSTPRHLECFERLLRPGRETR